MRWTSSFAADTYVRDLVLRPSTSACAHGEPREGELAACRSHAHSTLFKATENKEKEGKGELGRVIDALDLGLAELAEQVDRGGDAHLVVIVSPYEVSTRVLVQVLPAGVVGCAFCHSIASGEAIRRQTVPSLSPSTEASSLGHVVTHERALDFIAPTVMERLRRSYEPRSQR